MTDTTAHLLHFLLGFAIFMAGTFWGSRTAHSSRNPLRAPKIPREFNDGTWKDLS